MRKITQLTLLLAFSSLSIQAQTRNCGMVAHMEEQMKNPEFAQEWYDNQAKFKAQVLQSISNEQRQSSMNPIVIPVAVHFPSGLESDRACLEALAQTQIDILNGDYTATNSDANLWDSASQFYPNSSHGVANITFCIATQNHPNNTDADLVEGGPAVTIGYNFGGGGDLDSAWSGYMNFLVKSINGGVLGYSPLGGSIAAGQSVVMNLFAFGSGAGCPNSGVVPGAPYNLGRTVTHELGHFYNLSHIWGDGGCGVDDGISDTPLASGSNGGCPSPGSIPGCVAGEYEMSMNYMDYTNDACMYMFTQGQMDVVDNYINVLQSQFKPNVTSNCGTPTGPDFSITATNSPVFSCPTTGEDAVFEFDFTALNDYDITTSFSATGVPNNASVSFSPPFISDTGTVTMTIGNIANTTTGDYTITVSASSFVANKSVDVVLKNNCTSVQCNSLDSDENLNISIPDGTGANEYGDAITSIITVPDLGSISSITANVDVTHSYIQDLIVVLYHPDQTTYAILWGRDCAGEDGFDVTFSDEGSTISCANPTVGTYAPYEPLSIFEGMDSTGDWTLMIQDGYNDDVGVLNDWSIEICTEAPLSVSSNPSPLDEVLVYPNPSDGLFNIELQSNQSADIEISVYDVRGRIIFVDRYDNTIQFKQTIDLSQVNSGIYIMEISDGKNTINKRIIKQ